MRKKTGTTPGGRKYVATREATGKTTKIYQEGTTKGSYAKYSGDHRGPRAKGTKPQKESYWGGSVKKGPTKPVKK